jgi:hypothetical protein
LAVGSDEANTAAKHPRDTLERSLRDVRRASLEAADDALVDLGVLCEFDLGELALPAKSDHLVGEAVVGPESLELAKALAIEQRCFRGRRTLQQSLAQVE